MSTYFLKLHQKNKRNLCSKILLITLTLILLCSLTACTSNKNSTPTYSVTIAVESEGNWFFNKYDFSVEVDEEKLFDLAHGDKEKDTIKLETGSHAITITTADLSSNNKVTIPIEVEKDQEYTYKISCENSKFVVTDSLGVSYDSSVKDSVIADPTSLIPADAEVLDIDRATLYSHPFVLEGNYVRTVVVPTEIDDTYFEAEPSDEDAKFLIFWHEDFENAVKNISAGQPVAIIGKVSGYATAYNTVHIEDAAIDSTNPAELQAELEAAAENNNQLLHEMTLESFEKAFNSKTVAAELEFVCEQTDININGIFNIEASDDWAGGKRFSFWYMDFGTSNDAVLTVACNADSSIQSLKYEGIAIYERGYEPYSIKDYISTSSYDTAYSLFILSQNQIETLLKYPSTAKFDPDYSYTCSSDIYTISGIVSAKNALGVQQEMAYIVKYQVIDETATLKYLKLDGTVYLNHLEGTTPDERKQVSIETPADTMPATTSTDSEIRLVYSELGDYGKLVSYDGIETIEYHVFPGTYEITNHSNLCKVYLTTDEYHKNVDGYMENELIDTIEFTAQGQKDTLSVGEGEHLELTIGADVTLVPIT